MKVSPAVIAGILFILVASYILYKFFFASYFEGFDAAYFAALKLCDDTYQKCLDGGNTNTYCTTNLNNCVEKLRNPSVSNQTPQGSNETSMGSSAVAAMDYTKNVFCQNDYNECIKTKGESACKLLLDECKKESIQNVVCNENFNKCLRDGTSLKVCEEKLTKCKNNDYNPDTSVGGASTDSQGVLNKEMLQDILNKLITSGASPDQKNLDLIQGGSITNPNYLTSDEILSAYKAYQTNQNSIKPVTIDQISSTYQPSQNIIKPHQNLPQYKANVSVSVPTDSGTMAEKIRSETIVTPSIRQNIRQEIDDVVKDELNPYAVTYQMS